MSQSVVPEQLAPHTSDEHPQDEAVADAPAEGHRTNCEVCGSSGVSLHLIDLPEQRTASDPQVTAVLCRKHSERLQSRVTHWLAAMTATEGHHVTQGRRLRDGEAAHLIRTWAIAQGYPVGRTSLSTQIIAAYREAHTQVASES